ncbi:putative uncharacterized protein [Carnobacterium maltaromaticum LMA28]|uniref:Uncharacterized protein n=1 Tax=Carnobacterium maltaromaticum LMA28 TaxID=1234679 RepID=K8EHJ0_CARML|nr:hypothetical protein [Carnobacterium maltaromaticum]CCO11308.2 putative uncharacterized protein [Carnobacterium maltaromaticum LMA28]
MITEQPNGLYCRFSTITDCPTHYNMTFDDYVKVIHDRGDLTLEGAQKEALDIVTNYNYDFENTITILKIQWANSFQII